MTETSYLPEKLQQMTYFSRKDYSKAMLLEHSMSESQIAYNLQKNLDNGSIVHVSWNKYSIAGKKKQYSHHYSDVVEEIIQRINESYFDLDYQVFELIQLNEFMNHQMAHNTILLSVENELQDFVFETLKDMYPGKVMLKPGLTEYYRYLQDDEIIVGRLPTETPKGIDKPWQSRLEKILVDIFTDKLVSKIVPENEKDAIMNGAFSTYLLDPMTMIRYAKRKGADQKIIKILNEYEVTIA